ncbi:hypothetical protein [Methylomonas rosea]|uniref:Glycosyltransferase RgtA/B/C/D-like domain-containing protein n=1 Tax=Methylomonas rosea TaxID=2952227 RepID=A0ABT1TTU1_9GAMM|nr:hypothetical protein [Methylomonas sp. WSC-7]MCQ8118184.1 hypothetical protein [Methylomonas sp. WSC-7]
MYKLKLTAIYGHVFLCSIGLIGLILKLIRALSLDGFFLDAQLQLSNRLLQPWQGVLSLGKREQLLSYVLVLAVIVIYYFFSYLYVKRESTSLQNNIFVEWLGLTWQRIAGYLLSVFLINVFLITFFDLSRYYLVFMTLIFWLLIFVLPIQFCLSNPNGYKLKLINSSLITVCIFVIALIPFVYYVDGGGPLENEFQDIQEQTILESGQVVVNNKFINEHGIGGLVRYDPVQDQGMDPKQLLNSGVPVKMTPEFQRWLSEGDRPLRYFYSPASKRLYVSSFQGDERSQLTTIFDVNSKSIFRSGANVFSSQRYSDEEWDFVRRNKSELINQALAGHYFHHHFALIASINDYILGKPPETTHYTYGWGNTIFVAALLKLTGGFSFEKYVQVLYLFYPVYFFMLVGVVWLIFKDKNYVILASLVALIFFYAQGFESVRFAPGLNPIRHFLDVIVLYLLYRYWANNTILPLVLALFVCALAIFANKEFGLVLYLSMMIGVLISNLFKPQSVAWIFLLLALILCPFLWFSNPVNPFGTFSYVLSGLSVPDTPFSVVFVVGLLISIITALLSISNRTTYWYLTVFWLFYGGASLIYFIWNPAPNHIFSLGSIFAVLFVLLLKTCISSFGSQEIELKVSKFSSMILFIALLPLIMFFLIQQNGYINYFKSHVMYNWQFDTAKFETTMEPTLFSQAVDIIKKYSSGSEIYLISKYSNILPWLSGKYNSVPYNELALELVSGREVLNTIEFISKKQPEYIFVDTDINRTSFGDVYNPSNLLVGYLGVGGLSRDKALLFENLRLVTDSLLQNYKVVESGALVTVYKKV